jgi:DNA polymerase I-like protein with 3'-5' exonuclease and polymerase domains
VKQKSKFNLENSSKATSRKSSGEKHLSLSRPDSTAPLHPDVQSRRKITAKVGEVSRIPYSPRVSSLPSAALLNVAFGRAQYPFRRWVPALGRVITGPFALDTETTLIEDNRPTHVPILVLGAAFDGRQGWFILAKDMPAFLASHPTNSLIFHNAAFDLAVLQKRLGAGCDLYTRVEAGKVADTMILARQLSLGVVGHSARNQCSLDYCAGRYLSLPLPKDLQTPGGESVRLTFGKYLGRPFESFPAQYLQYAAGDPVATWLLFKDLKARLHGTKTVARQAYGYASDKWLEEQWKKHGLGTHNIQLRASIVLDKISRTGVLIDQARRDEKVAFLEQIVNETHHTLALAGLPVEGAGKTTALQKRIRRIAAEHKQAGEHLPLSYTETGQISTNEEQIKELTEIDPVLGVLLEHRQATKLLSTYAKKMVPGKRVHGRFNFLMNTGRTSCDGGKKEVGGFNLQNLPKELDATANHATTIRGCFVPAPGNVFVVVDYAQIELVVLGWAWKYQLGFGGSLHGIVSEGRDMHRLIAAHVLGKIPEEVSRQERNAAKPVSLGRPGGLGRRTIQKQAKNNYGVELTEEQVQARMLAYETLCPELTEHLKSRVNAGYEIARALGLTPAAYNEATGRARFARAPEDDLPAGWLGGMLLKVLESPVPMTGGNPDTGNQPRPYTPVELEFYWQAAARLPADELDQKLRDAIRERKPSKQLRDAVSSLYSREPVITATGRLRANASYSACRNGIMQGLAADGAIYALWSLMRAGYSIVNFIHDEVIIEIREDENLPTAVADIERLMIEGMQTVVPGANVRVETEVRRSFSKVDVR